MDEEQLLPRIADLERRLDWLYRATGYGTASSAVTQQPPGPVLDTASAEVLDLVRQGRKLEAIKVYRERTGVGLRQAKEAVERTG